MKPWGSCRFQGTWRCRDGEKLEMAEQYTGMGGRISRTSSQAVSKMESSWNTRICSLFLPRRKIFLNEGKGW